MTSLANKRIVVTGGSGFLGRHVVAALATRGGTVLVPRKAQYDLTSAADAERMYLDLRPQIVLHLAAVVGGVSYFIFEKFAADSQHVRPEHTR